MSILTRFSSEIKIENSRRDEWLVAYGFPGSKPNPHFFKKLVELTSNLERNGAYVDKSRTSIFMTNDLYGAVIAVKLAKHYGADVRLYKVEEMDPDSSFGLYYWFTLEKDEVGSVGKAVYNMLRDLSEKGVHIDEDITQLVIFLWVSECSTKPSLPLKQQDLEHVVEKFEYLENNGTNRIQRVPYDLVLENVVPIMRAAEKFLEDHKQSSMEDVNILFNVLKRLSNIEHDPFEPSMGDIEELLLEHPVDNLFEYVKKARITHEIL
jgi:hypothetical protein